MRIIHTADWHLGKSFAQFTPEVRSGLSAMRNAVHWARMPDMRR